MAEVDDAVLTRLKGAHALLDRLLRDPKTRREAEKLVKVHRPDFTTTDDVAAPYIEQISSLEKKLDEYITGEKHRKQDTEADAAFERLRKTGYTDEGIDKIKNLMKERTIPDVEAAAALFDKLNPPASPAPPSGFEGSAWNIGDSKDESDKLLFEDPDRWAEQEAIKAFRETPAE